MTATSGSFGDPIRQRLRPGETVLWRGQPDVNGYSMRGAWFLVPFSIAWCAFAIFWESTAIIGGAPPFFVLWGIPFVALGLYMVFGRILVARREARGTRYAITDGRVLIVIGGFRPRIVEMALVDTPPAQLELNGNGSGSITFGPSPGPWRLPPGWPIGGMYGQAAAFTAIPDASNVYRVLQDAKAAARGR